MKKFILCIGLSLLLSASAIAHDSPYHLKKGQKIDHPEYMNADQEPQMRGRNEFSFLMDVFGMFGINSDKFDVFFDTPATNLKNASYGGRLGIEGTMKKRFGFRLSTGYQRAFYSNIGIQQIKQNYITSDLMFMFYPKKEVNRWDYYLMTGPNVLVSKSGIQAYLTAGAGVRYFFNDKWSFKMEPSFVTDYSGIWGRIATGFNYHF